MALPLITKRQTQMTYNAAEDKGSMNNGSTPRNKERPILEEKYWSTDIVKQVETWMKNQRFSEQYAPSSQRSQQYTPPIQSERSLKRRRKRQSQKDGESGGAYTESINYTDSEIVSTAESKAIQRKFIEKEDKKIMRNNGVKVYPSRVESGHTNRENMYNKSIERPSKNSRFGSIHDEIEFQKRYKRISDLQNHLQFVNGSYLSGKNILVEKKLAPVTDCTRRFKQLNPSEMFAISPLEHLNIKTKSKQKHFLQATQVSHNNRYKSKKKPFPWQKFKKLPDISPDSKPPNKALSESDVHLGDEIGRDTARSGYVSSLLSQDDTKDERAKSVVTNSSYGPYQEMKVTIHIRYKKPQSSPIDKSEDESVSETSSVQSSEDNTSPAYDGRVHSINQEKTTSRETKITTLSQNDQNLVHSTNFRGLSRTSNMSKSSKENYKNYEGGTLSSLVISDPVSKIPRHYAGKIRE